MADLAERLEKCYPGMRVALVLDHWDQARESAESCIDVDSLEELQNYVDRSQRHFGNRFTSRLGLLLVSRMPSAAVLLDHVRANHERPGFLRLSRDLDRRLRHIVTFPFLTKAHAAELLAERGHGADGDLLELCGGWIGLLLAAVDSSEVGDPDGLASAVSRLLTKSVLPAVAARTQLSQREAWSFVLRDIASGADQFSKYALPSRFATGATPSRLSRLPAALLNYQHPAPLMIVDVLWLNDLVESLDVDKQRRGDITLTIVDTVRDRYGISVEMVQHWAPLQPAIVISDIRTKVVVLSNRWSSIVSNSRQFEDLIVVTASNDLAIGVAGALAEAFGVDGIDLLAYSTSTLLPANANLEGKE
ncbi:hypothetical protein EV580_3407 [Mycobacterium sp. BK086]|nr:hypothetical protein EV580_3407 [Mycobacterium sp. BK086]